MKRKSDSGNQRSVRWAALLAAFLAAPTLALAQYTIEAIPTPIAVNDAGQVLTESGIWENGVITPFDLASVTSQPAELLAITNTGEVLMNLVPTGQIAKRPFTWSGGVFTDIGALVGPNTTGSDMNNPGEIAGVTPLPDVPYGGPSPHGFLWDGVAVNDLGRVGWGSVKAVNDTGFVLMNSASSTRSRSSSGWKVVDSTTGTSTPVQVISYYGKQWSVGINNSNQVVSWGYVAATNRWGQAIHVLLTDAAGNTTDAGGLGDFYVSQPTAINDLGEIVGNALFSLSRQANRPFIIDGLGVLQELSALLPAGSGWTLVSAVDISNTGEIVGMGWKGGVLQGFILKPTTTNTTIPTITAGPIVTDEDTPASTLAVVVNPDAGETLSFAIVAPAAHGLAAVDGAGLIDYTPDPDFFGGDTFVVRVTDSAGASAATTVNVTVNPVNDPPASASASITTDEGTVSAGVDPVVVDVDDTSHTFSIITQPSNGHAYVTVPDNQLVYDPSGNFSGSDSFTFLAMDGGGLAVLGTALVTVIPVNDPPVAVNDSYSATESTALSGASVLTNDNDPDGDPMTAALVAGPSHGTLSLAPDGTFVYAPYLGFVGSDSFTYRASDGLLNSNVATASIIVSAMVVTPPAAYTIEPIPMPVALNDLGQVLTVSGVWDGGAVTPIDLASVTSQPAELLDINNSGQVVMNLIPTGQLAKRAFTWSGGTFTDIGALIGPSTVASGINNFGEVVGTTPLPDTPYVSPSPHGFLWDGLLTDLGGVGWGSVKAVNDTGFVLMNTSFSTRTRTSSGWKVHDSVGGTSTLIQVIAKYGKQWSVAMNNNNEVVSWGFLDVNTPWKQAVRVLFTDAAGSTTDAGGLGDFYSSQPTAINDLGEIVGNASMSISRRGDRPFLIDGTGTVFDLNALLPPASGWSLVTAVDVNNSGQIVGVGIFGGAPAGYLLTPVAAP